MAILSSTGISGFLSSARATGKQILNKAGKLIPEYIEDFVSGFAGHGWKIWNYRSETDSENKELKKYKLEIDSITVRESMTVFELLIQKIRAVKGALSITQASGKVATALFDEDTSEWLLTVEDEMSFVAHDIIRCQSFANGKLKGYWVEISEIRKIEGVDTIVIPAGEFEGGIGYDPENNNAECVDKTLTDMITPAVGDEIIQFGNSKMPNRQSAVYIHADEGGQPAIDILFGISTKSFAGCVKTRIGGDIPGGNGAKGFYCENGMIKCVDDTGSLIYEFKPDGSFSLGKRKIVYDPTEDKLKFGAGVTLAWDNIADDAKDNLKGDKGDQGEKGDKGDPGVNGADGVNGEDGVSLSYKGELDSHPANPQNGWYYRNMVDKKCYVYQDGAWYVMTVDGADGKNGIDGINGKDGNDGLSVVWKGDLSTPPVNPQKNWCYRDTDNGRVYIYNGTAWELMIADGNDGIDGTQGADGLSVFITYNDDPDEVDPPTGDGTADGWHTDATSNVVWMSQKVAESAVSGTWGNPVRIKGNPGNDAVLYEIITPVSIIRYIKNHGPYPDNMKLSVRKTIGNTFINITTDAAMVSERLTLKYLEPMGEGLGEDYQPWSIDEIMSSQYFIDGIKLRLYKGNSLVSHKELTLVEDGQDGQPGSDADVPEWLKKWNGYATEIGSEYIVTPAMFTGKKNPLTNALTGIVQGKECIEIEGKKHSGIFALEDDKLVFSLDPVTKKYLFRGRVEATEGSFSGNVTALSGNIGCFKVLDGNLTGYDKENVKRIEFTQNKIPKLNELLYEEPEPLKENIFRGASVIEYNSGNIDGSDLDFDYSEDYIDSSLESYNRLFWMYDIYDFESSEPGKVVYKVPFKLLYSGYVTFDITSKINNPLAVDNNSVEIFDSFNRSRGPAQYRTLLDAGDYYLKIILSYFSGNLSIFEPLPIQSEIYINRVTIEKVVGCNIIGTDGIISRWGANKYLFFNNDTGFEIKFDKYGLKIDSNGIKKLTNGSWSNL